MPWPTPQDYNEAIQNPSFTFSDRELQSGSCEVTALGLPKPITGNFASVYRLHCQDRDWAVRCFWRELSDMQQRYRAISAHLAAAALPYTVGFEYQPRGIRVRGSWYPILKMEWVEGQLLNDFLVSHLSDPLALETLKVSWVRMVCDLERSGCAHGDLQHGNVLVVNGELKLVDYDGMFVPALRGMRSHELGQQHYQHPQRDATDFGPHLDRFSSWVIYLSIAAVQVDPSLWVSTQAGDERLLLQRNDFVQPSTSPALELLAGHTDPELQVLASEFRAAIEKPVKAVPSLSTALSRGSTVSGVDPVRASTTPSRLNLWWRIVVPSSPADTIPQEVPPFGSHPSWVIDHLPARSDYSVVWSDGHVRSARVAALASLPVSGVGGIALLAFGMPTVLAIVVCVLVWMMASFLACLVAYRGDPTVRTLLPLVRLEVQALAALADSERARRRIDSRMEREVRRNARNREATARRVSDLQHREQIELEKVRAELVQTLDSLETRIREVDRRETEETEHALADLQSRHIAETLRRATLRRATIPGIDLATKMRLWTLGVWAAADVTSDRIRTMQHLDHDRLLQVVGWRVATETEARRTMPRHIPAEQKRLLHRKYASERVGLVTERSQSEAMAHVAMQEMQASFSARRSAIEDRLNRALQDSADASASLQARIEQLRSSDLQYSATRQTVLQKMQTRNVAFGEFMRVVWLPRSVRQWRAESPT